MLRFIKLLADWFYDQVIYPFAAKNRASDGAASPEDTEGKTR